MDGTFLEFYIFVWTFYMRGKGRITTGILLFEILAPLPQDLPWAHTPCVLWTEIPIWKLSWAFCPVSTASPWV